MSRFQKIYVLYPRQISGNQTTLDAAGVLFRLPTLTGIVIDVTYTQKEGVPFSVLVYILLI